MDASDHAKQCVPEFLSNSVECMAIGGDRDHVDSMVGTVLLHLMGHKLTTIVDAKGKEVDATGFAHGVNEDLDGVLEDIGLLAQTVDPGLVGVVVDDIDNIVLVVNRSRGAAALV